MEKFCKKCKLTKNLNEFNKKKTSKDGYRNECKLCIKEYKKEYNKIWYNTNKIIINEKAKDWARNNPDKIKEINKRSRDKGVKEKTKEYMSVYRKNNKEKILLQRKKYLENNPEMKKKFNSNRYKNMTTLQKLKHTLRCSLNKVFKNNGYIKKSKSNEIYGCSYDFLLIYIESKFEFWMNWNNHGLYNGDYNYGWDIDHIIPLAMGITEEEIIKLCHYTNLQPLCSRINRNEKRDN
jgi:hypothetical protein